MEITLFMIVKNESHIIERCLNSVKDIVNSIVISDTGSTDNTVELINTFLETHSEKIKGTVYIDEWKNFGYNRTKSYTNAQEWLRNNKYDLNSQFLLTIDADMIFKVDPAFNKKELSKKDSWLIRQKNPIVVYFNKRLFRASFNFKCIGVTHEYWGCPEENPSEDLLETLYIEDIGDGGAKADKLTRDIRLLTQGLIDEPNNERYFFYLAQSYTENGNKEKGIEYYKKRIEAGGWNEEVFMAYLRLGDIYSVLKNDSEAIYWWSLGYEHLPSRAETLWRIINTYRIMGKNQLALMYFKTAVKIPFPETQLLFIEKAVYDYKLLEELSIFGYYTEFRRQAFLTCDYLRLQKNIPGDVKHACNSNLFFYIESFNKTNKPKFSNMLFKFEDPYICSSPSFFKSEKGFFGNARAVNYSMNKQFQYSIRGSDNVKTKNYWIEIENNVIISQYELLIDHSNKPKRTAVIQGLEDLRLCKIDEENKKDHKYVGLATSFEYGNYNIPSVCLCILEFVDSKYRISNIFATNYNDSICQKNWCPFYEKNKLFAIYSHSPLTILDIDIQSGETKIAICKEQSAEEYDLSSFRGSTSPIKLPNGNWIMVVHEIIQKDTRKYFHRFVVYDENWDLVDVSIPFYFKELFVEFTLSMSYSSKDDSIYIFFSKEDNSSEIMTIKYSDIEYLPLKKNIKNIY